MPAKRKRIKGRPQAAQEFPHPTHFATMAQSGGVMRPVMKNLRVFSLPLPSLLLLWLLPSCSPADSNGGVPLDTIKLPPGFAISVYASNVPNARSMALSPHGTLFVGTRTEGNVYAIIDRNQDNQA